MLKIILSFFLTGYTLMGQAQELKVVKYAELESILAASPSQPKLINFWATWCKPCVEELPYFTETKQQLNNSGIEFIFVSLDFMSQTPKVKELIKNLNLNGTLLQLNEPGGEWIDALDKNWSGAIPYTILILPDGTKKEHYDSFNSTQDLRTFLDKNLTN